MKNSKKFKLIIRFVNNCQDARDRRMDNYDKRWESNKKGIEDAHFTELREQILKQEVGKNREKYFARFVGPDVMKSEFF